MDFVAAAGGGFAFQHYPMEVKLDEFAYFPVGPGVYALGVVAAGFKPDHSGQAVCQCQSHLFPGRFEARAGFRAKGQEIDMPAPCTYKVGIEPGATVETDGVPGKAGAYGYSRSFGHVFRFVKDFET